MQEAPRKRRWLRELSLHGAGILATIVIFELVLHLFNFPYLRADDWGSMQYRHDAEIGWTPAPKSHSISAMPRDVTVSHNSLGTRDVEFERNGRPTILFMGDSLTWGYNVEASERFSDLLRGMIPSHNVLNAGVSGFGTDQAYLFLKRLWPDVEPSVVVLIFCVENDHSDNSRNLRYFNYKPYLETSADGTRQFRGQPVPRSRKSYFQKNWFTQNLVLVRLAISGYMELAYPRITVPDATEPLIAMMRDEVVRRGAKFLVGLERQDPPVERFLKQEGIPYVLLDGAEFYDSSHHWSTEGHKLVAGRLASLLSANGIAVSGKNGEMGNSGAEP
jgi:hypothetical protein